MKSHMLSFLIWTVSFALTACSGHSTGKPDTNAPVNNNSSESISDATAVIDRNGNGKAELTKLYSKAISNFIEAVSQKDKLIFDTLFLGNRKNGQPDDFPDIELPETINGTKVRLLTQAEADENKQRYRNASPYINLIGWVDKDNAEFVFITFFPEFQHQYDCYINYKYNAATNEFDLKDSRIEVLVLGKDGKPDHFAIYQNGKHTGDKPIN